jgi:hypothetical protein
MADACVETHVRGTQLRRDGAVREEQECVNCDELERKLKDTIEELSSVKLLLKCLQMELTLDRSLDNLCGTTQHYDDYSVNVMDESNEWTIVTNNHQRMTSWEDNGDVSQWTTLIPIKN